MKGTILYQGSSGATGTVYTSIFNTWEVEVSPTLAKLTNARKGDVLSQNNGYRLFTYTIASTDISQVKGAAVTQDSGNIVGVLHTALTGTGMTTIIVRSNFEGAG